MNELERLLVACVRWHHGQEDAHTDNLTVVADWLADQSRDSEAAAVRAIFKAATPPDPGEDPYVGDDEAVVANWLRVEMPGGGTVEASQEFIKPRFRRRDDTGYRPLRECVFVVAYPPSKDPIEVYRSPDIGFLPDRYHRLAKWHAACHVLGYSPVRLLAACTAEARRPSA